MSEWKDEYLASLRRSGVSGDAVESVKAAISTEPPVLYIDGKPIVGAPEYLLWVTFRGGIKRYCYFSDTPGDMGEMAVVDAQNGIEFVTIRDVMRLDTEAKLRGALKGPATKFVSAVIRSTAHKLASERASEVCMFKSERAVMGNSFGEPLAAFNVTEKLDPEMFDHSQDDDLFGSF